MSYDAGVIRLMMGAQRQLIFGSAWDKTSSPTLTRTDSAVGKVAGVGLDAGGAVNDFDSLPIFSEFSEVTDASGNVFVRIPKFYIKKTDGVGYKTWQVSKTSIPGGYLPWCFWDFTGGAELDYVDVGKYIASLDGTNKLESKPDKYPQTKRTITQFRTFARNNASNYQIMDVHIYDVIRTLFYIEFATLNCQSIMYGWAKGANNAAHTAQVAELGANRIIVTNAVAAEYRAGQPLGCGTTVGGDQVFYGRTITSITVYDATRMALNFDGAAADIAVGNIVYNIAWRNGWSSVMTASSGSIGSNSDGEYPCQYRGIENPYCNDWQFVDGVNFQDADIYICNNAASYAVDTFVAPYNLLSYGRLTTTGVVPGDMGYDANYPCAEFPVTDGGVDYSQYYCDSYSYASGNRIAITSGYNYKGLEGGLHNWHTNNPSNITSFSFLARLCRKATP